MTTCTKRFLPFSKCTKNSYNSAQQGQACKNSYNRHSRDKRVFSFRLFICGVTLTFDLHYLLNWNSESNPFLLRFMINRLDRTNLDEKCGSWCTVHPSGQQLWYQLFHPKRGNSSLNKPSPLQTATTESGAIVCLLRNMRAVITIRLRTRIVRLTELCCLSFCVITYHLASIYLSTICSFLKCAAMCLGMPALHDVILSNPATITAFMKLWEFMTVTFFVEAVSELIDWTASAPCFLTVSPSAWFFFSQTVYTEFICSSICLTTENQCTCQSVSICLSLVTSVYLFFLLQSCCFLYFI